MVMTEIEQRHAAVTEMAAKAAPEAVRAVILFQREFGRLPDAREQRLLVDAIVDYHVAQLRTAETD
jgi:hypothetical protein